MKCLICRGKGKVVMKIPPVKGMKFERKYDSLNEVEFFVVDCPYCDGTGEREE